MRVFGVVVKIKLLAILPCVALEVVIASAISAAAQQETILLNLNCNGQVGGDCLATLTGDAAGNIYGTSGIGGQPSGGTVFESTQ